MEHYFTFTYILILYTFFKFYRTWHLKNRNSFQNTNIPEDCILVNIHSLVFSLRGRAGRNQSPVTWPVWLWHCILGKSLGVVCHCFPPPLDLPTFAARCLYVRNDARDPSSESWNCGREICPVILPKFWLPHKFRDLLHAANLRHGTDSFTSPPKEGALRIFSP